MVRLTGRRDERGFVIVLVALSLLVMLILTALVVDLGQGRQRRRSSQNAADAAALASVQELPDGPWQTAGADYVNENDFDAAVASLDRGDWDDVTETFNPSSTGECVKAVTEETGDSIFGSVVGSDEITVRTNAIACRTEGGSGIPAIFANSTTCDNTIQVNGTGSISGGIHTNDDVKFGGAGSGDMTVIGVTTYVDSAEPNTNTVFDPDENNPRKAGVKPLPVNIPFSDYQPGGDNAIEAAAAPNPPIYVYTTSDITRNFLENNGYLVGGALTPGLYVTTKDVKLSGGAFSTGIGGNGVTFVAQNTIDFSGNNIAITPWDDPDYGNPGSANEEIPDPVLVAYGGTGACGPKILNLSGSNHNWEGLIFVPNGLVDISGSGNFAFSGNIVGDSVKLTGSNINIEAFGEDVEAIDEFFLVD